MKKKAISAKKMLCEAYEYKKPVPFSRGFKISIKGVHIIFISGTASVSEKGEALFPGDIKKQSWRTFENITSLLAAEGASWKDVVRTTIYITDMRDYDKLNEVRNEFFKKQGIKTFPASTCIEARLVWPELLVEIEAIAIYEDQKNIK